jgi:hypothetical protein
MERISLIDVCKHILTLQRDVYTEFSRTGEINQDVGTQLADCLDFCTYLALDMIEGEGSKEVYERELEKEVVIR